MSLFIELLSAISSLFFTFVHYVMSSHIVLVGTQIISSLIIVYFIILNGFYFFTTLSAFRALRKHVWTVKSITTEDLMIQSGFPAVTIIAPAYNEEATCVESIKSLLSLSYSDYTILFVNDGSKDTTLARVIAHFGLIPRHYTPIANLQTAEIRGIFFSPTYPRLLVIDKKNGGKADALNAGINFTRTPLFAAIDADTLLERDALVRLVRPFLEDVNTVAAGGIIRIANGCKVKAGKIEDVRMPKHALARLQILEYLRAFLASRMGWSHMNAMLIISGAFGFFRTSHVINVGGYYKDTIGEDMELVVRLHRYFLTKKIPYRIVYAPDPVAWTECPEDWKTLKNQRVRWQIGLLESLTRHREMLFNRKFGKVGTIAYPYFYLLEGLGPILEFAGYIIFVAFFILGKFSSLYVISFFIVAVLMGILLSLSAIALGEFSYHRYKRTRDLLLLCLITILESFGYRQIQAYYRFLGTYRALFTRRRDWGKMERKGFGSR
jgi:cellulose synthase/poly-beta-1,6-N-acetylglucosamine synthase-like glycosyltransferase